MLYKHLVYYWTEIDEIKHAYKILKYEQVIFAYKPRTRLKPKLDSTGFT